MNQQLLTLLFVGVIGTLPLSVPAKDFDDPDFITELVVNGGAENYEDPLYGWRESPQVGIALHDGEIGFDDSCTDLGEQFFTMSAQPIPARQAFMRQQIDLVGYGRRTFLAKACIRTREGDRGGVEVTFYDRRGRVLGKTATRLRSAETWEEHRLSGRIPRRAAFARITVRGRDRLGDRMVDVDVDNIGFNVILPDDPIVCGSIPPGHLPPPGECRIWFPDRPPGHQPPPGPCDKLKHEVPPGACLVYG